MALTEGSWLLPALVLFIAVLGLGSGCMKHGAMNEGWQDYTMKPYGYVKSGTDPLYFYGHNRYRKPYRYPFKYYRSYPYPHMSHLP